MQIIKNIVNFLSFIVTLQYSAQIHVPISFVVKLQYFGTNSVPYWLIVKLYSILAQIHVPLYFVVNLCTNSYSFIFWLSNYAVFLAQIHVPLSLIVKLYNILAQIHVPSSFVVKFYSIFGTNSCSFIYFCQSLQHFLAQIHAPISLIVKLYNILAQTHVPLSFAVKTMVFWHKFEFLLLSNFSIWHKFMFLYPWLSNNILTKKSCCFIFSCQPLQYFGTNTCSFIFCCQTTLFWQKLVPCGRSQPNPADANMDRLHDILEKHEQNIQLHNIKINMTWITLSDYMKYLQPVWSIWVLKQNQLRTTVALNVQFTKPAV